MSAGQSARSATGGRQAAANRCARVRAKATRPGAQYEGLPHPGSPAGRVHVTLLRGPSAGPGRSLKCTCQGAAGAGAAGAGHRRPGSSTHRLRAASHRRVLRAQLVPCHTESSAGHCGLLENRSAQHTPAEGLWPRPGRGDGDGAERARSRCGRASLHTHVRDLNGTGGWRGASTCKAWVHPPPTAQVTQPALGDTLSGSCGATGGAPGTSVTL